MNKKIGEIIREIRNEKGISLRKLAEIVNVSNVNILYIEKGKINTSLPVLKGIANALNYNIDKLFTWKLSVSSIRSQVEQNLNFIFIMSKNKLSRFLELIFFKFSNIDFHLQDSKKY